MKGEDQLIGWLRRRLETQGNRFLGDDAAALTSRGDLVMTVDQQIEGVHLPVGLDPTILGRRIVRVNLSDLAAMGARPHFALLALTLPEGVDAKQLFRGVLDECRRYEVTLTGGDLARGPRLAGSMTMAGTRIPRGHWLHRHSGRAGDLLWLGGSLGESAAGRLLLESGVSLERRRVRLESSSTRIPDSLAATARRAVRRHLEPEPQLGLGQWLARRPRCAAIDISDGLSLDLARLASESGCGAEIELERLPRAGNFHRLCETLGIDPQGLMLSGGEDYVLLFTLPAEVEPPAQFSCTRIGRLVERRGIWSVDGTRRQRLEARGWDHLG